MALPVFDTGSRASSGLVGNLEKRHTDFHWVGQVGYVEIRYHTDAEHISSVVLYHRTDPKFVALKSVTNLQARLAWDTAKFHEVENWLEQHLPAITDLGVGVSGGAPFHLDLGWDLACEVQTQVLTRPGMTNAG